jgi:DNA-binding XRE family transcriptional regulator
MPEPIKAGVQQSHEGMIAKLEAEVAEYLDLKAGNIHLPVISSLNDLAKHLAKFRIALGISQEQLAGMVGVSRQTINKHEEQEFQNADIAMMTRVMEALGILQDIRIQHQRLAVAQPHGLYGRRHVAVTPRRRPGTTTRA